jgi:hypothetical protein|tara:strand:- start:309 stop:743 length:435 start_codon:yes stop_codon:yes gene_type:complete
MEFLIILVVLSFLIGTISFALPSKSSREISELRINASRMGFKISPSNIGQNSFKNKDINLMIYSLKNKTNLKEAHFIRDKDELILYSPLKLKYSDGYDEIKSKLNSLSPHVLEIMFSSSFIAFIWREKAGKDELEKILNLLKVF